MDYNTCETILNRIIIFIKKPLKIDDRYKRMFHGKTELDPGRYYYCYPVTDISMSRMVNRFHQQYIRDIEYTFAYGGLKEM